MRAAHPLEQTIGIHYYVSDTDGTGGSLRSEPEDFRVQEHETVTPEPFTADPSVYEYLVIRVTLESWETHEFARELSDRLGISRERISWAGTKDKHAHTTQLFSIKGASVEDLPQIQRATIEPIGRLGRRILLGDLAGNEFTITVRTPEHPENVPDITIQLRDFCGTDDAVGVPNYFGPQRFGTTRPITHEVGFRILDRDWKGAVMAYIGEPTDQEPEETQAARAFVEDTEDWTAALDRLPTGLRYERSILHRLAETDASSAGDFQSALESLPTNLQRLFVHASQSFVFNRILSNRLERGLPFDRAVEGDVVCFTDQINGIQVPDTDRLHRATDGVDTINRHITRGRALVTAPLVGTDTEFAGGEPGELEREILEALDVTPTDFALPGAFGSTGTRRPILVRTDVTHSIDPLRFSFSLPKGSYATVLLREYLKSPPEDL